MTPTWLLPPDHPGRLAADERQRKLLADTERLARAFGWKLTP